jgi:hypothetical protein
MHPFLDAIGAGTCAAAGALLGHWCSRLPRHWWTVGYFLPLLLVLACAVAVHHPAISFTPPLSWLILGRKKIFVAGFAAAMLLTTPISRLPHKKDRVVVFVLMVVIALTGSVWPFLAPAFNHRQLEHLPTRVDADGVCRQGTDYTCGPASVVTALRKLGLPAEEGKIAILSGTSSSTGTPPDILAGALQEYYGRAGLTAEYRAFDDVKELREAGLTLAVIKFGFLVDHYVTVLQVTDSQVIIGDPLGGRDSLSYDEFREKWRFTGVVLKRPRQGPATGL